MQEEQSKKQEGKRKENEERNLRWGNNLQAANKRKENERKIAKEIRREVHPRNITTVLRQEK